MLSFRDGMISDRGNRNRGMKTDQAKPRRYQQYVKFRIIWFTYIVQSQVWNVGTQSSMLFTNNIIWRFYFFFSGEDIVFETPKSFWTHS